MWSITERVSSITDDISNLTHTLSGTDTLNGYPMLALLYILKENYLYQIKKITEEMILKKSTNQKEDTIKSNEHE